MITLQYVKSLSLFLIILLFAAYYNIGSVGFYLDDYSSIVNNPVLQVPIDYSLVFEKHFSRPISYLLLGLQNDLFQGQAAGFHNVGVFIHLLMSLLVYLFSNKVFSLNCVKNHEWWAIAVSAVFALHPQNSQAVIYIVQQTAMYVAFFYLLALYSFIKLRTTFEKYKKAAYLFLLVFTSMCAFLSKQNAITLPLAILLIEWCFFNKYVKQFVFAYFSFAVISLFFFALYKDINLVQLISLIDQATTESQSINRYSYFFTQLDVVANYVKQFFYPAYFALEYDVDLINSFFYVDELVLLLHFFLIGTALITFRKLPLLTFGILFYYLTISVESSFIPITDLVFEHRTYLPNVGLAIAFFAVLAFFIEKFNLPNKTYLILPFSIGIACCYLAFLTHIRVNQWVDEKLFYQNEIQLSPNSPRAYTELAKIYINEGNCPLAIGVSEHAINLYEKQRKSGLSIQPESYQNYILCLRELKIFDKANYFEEHLLAYVKEPIRRSYILFQRGTFMLSQRKFGKAEKDLTESIKLNGKNHSTAINLAITKVQLGKNQHAVKLLEHAIALKPDDQSIRDLLAKLQNGMD